MNIELLVAKAAELGASDIHIAYGQPPKIRVDGDLVDLPGEHPLSDADCEEAARQLLGEPMPPRGEIDLAKDLAGRRIRGNVYRQRGHCSAAIRLLADFIPNLENLGLPPVVANFPSYQKGIVLVTGETGSGKSTTLAAIIKKINETKRKHIITLEDPVEYVHESKLSLVDQRCVGQDTESYADGLRAILREDPDVILIGEMRDFTTIETAITAAETGHLVFATLHTSGAAESIDRIVDVFPSERQKQVRMRLSMTLMAVLSQQLLKKKGGGRVCACECMIVTGAIRNLIREGKTPQIANALATSANVGSITMDNFILKLLRENQIDSATAKAATREI